MTERFVVGGSAPLGEREVGVIASTNQLARDGHILEPSGLNLDNYLKNPIVLWQHDYEKPVGVCTAVGVVPGPKLAARIQFAPEGASRHSDEAFALTKQSRVCSAISIGFDPIDVEPLDPRMGSRGGMHILTADLLEISVVSVGADTGALVVERNYRSRSGAERLLRSLPRTSRSAIARVLDRIGRPPAGRPQVPFGLLPSAERARLFREHFASHALQAWAAGTDTREREQSLTSDARLARFRELER